MANTVKDPVCGMDVEKQAGHSENYGQTRYYFCSGTCQAKFHANPQDYIPQTG
jgi:Cu+-exporting ATPase